MSTPTREPIRTAVVGLGSIATYMHLPVLAADPRATVVAGCEVNAHQADRVRRQFGLDTVFDDWRRMLAEVRPDAVVIALPTAMHQEVARAALEANSHVFCEKPLGIDPDGAEALAALASERGRTLLVGYHNRFLPSFRKAREVLRAGKLGAPLSVHGTYAVGGPFLSWEPKSHWYHKLGGGGLLYDGGSHLLDLIGFLTGERVQTARVVGTTRNDENESPDQIALAWTTPAGMLGLAQLAWGARVARQEVFVCCEKGLLTATPLQVDVRTPRHNKLTDFFRHLDGAFRVASFIGRGKLRGGAPAAYRGQLAAFYDAIEGRGPGPASLSDAVATLRDLSRFAGAFDAGPGSRAAPAEAVDVPAGVAR